MSDINSNETQKQPSIKNSKRNIILPLILALTLIAGILLGYVLRPQRDARDMFSLTGASKINTILDLIHENYVDEVSTDSLEELAIPKILEALDPHTSYIPAKDLEELEAPLIGNFEGIGIQFNIQNDTIMVVNTIAGGPSEKIGVLAGDRIVMINDSLFAGIGITNNDVVKNLKGEAGTTVRISVKRAGIKDLIDFEITRAKIPLHSVDVSYMIDNEIGYVKISKFSNNTHREFEAAVKELFKSGMTKLVLDLRQNGGGYLKTAVAIADEFLSDGKMIVYTKGRARKRVDYRASDAGLCEDVELAVLIDSWSASASEIVAGAVQDNDRGIIIGRRSFGKGLVQEPFMFTDGSGMRLTIARYYTPTGRSIQKPYNKGIESYYADIYHRIADGEMEHADSIHFNDSLKFTTPGGKIVYGGGGITPDIFVPKDTSYYSEYINKIISKGLIYNFAVKYTDEHRKQLSKYKTADEINRYLEQQNVLNKFIAYAGKKGVKANLKDLQKSENEINIRLKAYVARNVINDIGYYPILQQRDVELKRAKEELKKQ